MLRKKLSIIINHEELRIKSMQNALKALPKGKLYTRKRDGKTYYSVYKDKKERWITKDPNLIKKYFLKDDLEKSIESVINTTKLINSVLKDIPRYICCDPIASQWAQAKYERNSYKQEHLKYKTMKGDLVRSKSERFIADTLFSLGIPYRYEYSMYINGHKLHPDFVILKPNGEFLIWEHFGLMEDELYRKNALLKIQQYQEAGYVQFKNLICTTEADLLNKEIIEDIILRFYFS